MTTGFGPRGEIEVQYQNRESVVRIPWEIAKRLGAIGTLLYIGLWVIVFLLWLGISPPERWWEIPFGWKTWGWWVWFWRNCAFILIPIVPIWGASLGFLAYANYIPKVINDKWPPPFAQINPLESGFYGAWSAPLLDDGEDDQAEDEHIFMGSISDGEGTTKNWRLVTTRPLAWQDYARALTDYSEIIRVKVVSFRTARKYDIPEDEFPAFRENWLGWGLLETTSNATNAHSHLTYWGEMAMQQILSQKV